MTTLTLASPAGQRIRLGRLAVCYATIAACVPYLVLKISWLAGSDIGWAGGRPADDTTLDVLNAVTLGMDTLAAGLALTFTHAWGRRVPAWLVVVPIWIATGLITPIVLGAPFAAIADAVGSYYRAPSAESPISLQGWVYAVVYGGFIVQGAGLAAVFVPYARGRWAHLMSGRIGDLRPGATHRLQAVLAGGGALLAGVYALANLFWAAGGTLGLPSGLDTSRPSWHVVSAVYGLVALAGAAALLTLVHRRGNMRVRVPLFAAWLGIGATFAGPLWQLTVALGDSSALHDETTPMIDFSNLAGMLGGLLMAIAGAALLAERDGRS